VPNEHSPLAPIVHCPHKFPLIFSRFKVIWNVD
jgi:hypothetical protein